MSRKQKQKEPVKFRFSGKIKATLLFLLFAIVYVILPFDILPFSFFDDIAIVVVAFAFWFFAIILEEQEVKKRNG